MQARKACRIRIGKTTYCDIIGLNWHTPKKGTDIHTATLDINPSFLKKNEDYLLQLKTERVIFNPDTENPELKRN
jgi:hypothetical protein